VSGRAVLALGTIYVVWGSTYLAIRVMVESVPPLLGAGVRFLAAGALLAAGIALVRGRGALLVAPRALGACATTGLLILVGGIGLVTVAEQDVPSSLAALVIASVPVWVVLLGAAGSERLGPASLAGIALGVVGVALVTGGAGEAVDAPWALGLLLVAAATTAIGLHVSPHIALPPDALVATMYEMLVAGVVLTLLGVATGELGSLGSDAFTTRSTAALLYLVVFGSIVGYGAFVWALQHLRPALVSTYAFVNPLVALVLGWALLDERLSPVAGAGAALVVSGVVALTLASTKAPAAPDAAG
jgi:drug/metabolite transporter (DMT)-like permease